MHAPVHCAVPRPGVAPYCPLLHAVAFALWDPVPHQYPRAHSPEHAAVPSPVVLPNVPGGHATAAMELKGHHVPGAHITVWPLVPGHTKPTGHSAQSDLVYHVHETVPGWHAHGVGSVSAALPRARNGASAPLDTVISGFPPISLRKAEKTCFFKI